MPLSYPTCKTNFHQVSKHEAPAVSTTVSKMVSTRVADRVSNTVINAVSTASHHAKHQTKQHAKHGWLAPGEAQNQWPDTG